MRSCTRPSSSGTGIPQSVLTLLLAAILVSGSAPEVNAQVNYQEPANLKGIPEYSGVVDSYHEPEAASTEYPAGAQITHQYEPPTETNLYDKEEYQPPATETYCPPEDATAATTDQYNAYRRSRGLQDDCPQTYNDVHPSEFEPPGNEGIPSPVVVFWAIFLMVMWCLCACCGYWCYLRALRRASATMQVVKVHDKTLHDINNALKVDEPDHDWDDAMDDNIPYMTHRKTYTDGRSPSSPLNKFLQSPKEHDNAKRRAVEEQRLADVSGGFKGRDEQRNADLYGREISQPEVHNTQLADRNDSLNYLAANDDMTLVVGDNEQWGANLN